MAIISCPECGQQVSDRAVNCPNCGYPIGEAPAVVLQNNADKEAQQIENLLNLARSSFNSKNYAQAEEFCNQAIAISSTNYDAWKLKGEAINFQINSKNQRILEVYNCIMTAYRSLEDTQKADKKEEILSSLKMCMEGEIKFWLDQFEAGRPTNSALNRVINSYEDCYNKLSDAFTELECTDSKRSYLICFDNFFIQTANQISVSSWKRTVAYNYFRNDLNNCGAHWNRDTKKIENGTDYFRPSEEIRSTFVTECDILTELLEYCAKHINSKTSIETIENLYNNMAYYTEMPSEQCSYKPMCSTWTNGYGAVTSRKEYYEIDRYLTDSAKKVRSAKADVFRSQKNCIVAARKRDLAEKQRLEREQRIKQYWENHADERLALEARKKELDELIPPLKEQLNLLEAKLQQIKDKSKTPVPASAEKSDLRKKISKLECEKNGLGVFKSKEKKILQAQIDELNAKIPAIDKMIEEQMEERKKSIDAEIASGLKQIDEISIKYKPLLTERDNILEELSKDR